MNVSVAVWRGGVGVGRIDNVALHRARLVLGCVTVFWRENHPVTQVNPASFSQRDGKCIPPKSRHPMLSVLEDCNCIDGYTAYCSHGLNKWITLSLAIDLLKLTL